MSVDAPLLSPFVSLDSFKAVGLAEGGRASLTLHRDGSCVFEKDVIKRGFSGCFSDKNASVIAPAGSVVGALLTAPCNIQVWYMPVVKSKSGRSRRILKKMPPLKLSSDELAELAVDHIRTNCTSSQPSDPRKVFVIVNPVSGPGKAMQTYEQQIRPIFLAAGFKLQEFFTQRRRHATEAILQLKPGEVDVIVAIGGDGTTYEALQGILGSPNWDVMRKVPLVQIPCGSGNALAASTGLWDALTAAHAVVRGLTTSLDVASVIQPASNSRHFSFLSLTYGTIPALDIGTEQLRCLGEARFTLGGLKEVMKQTTYKVKVAYLEAIKEENTLHSTSLPTITDDVAMGEGPPLKHLTEFLKIKDAHTSLANTPLPTGWKTLRDEEVQLFAACNLPYLSMSTKFAPEAVPNSGWMNLVYSKGRAGRLKGIDILTAAETGSHMKHMEHKKLTAIALEPLSKNKTWVVVDGEPVEHALTFMEMHPRLCCTIQAPIII